MSRRNGIAETISTFALGVGVGAALGILFAPKAGEDTREYLADTARQGMDQAVSKGRDWAQRAQKAASDVSDQLQDNIESGKDAVRQAAKSASSS